MEVIVNSQKISKFAETKLIMKQDTKDDTQQVVKSVDKFSLGLKLP